MAKVQEIGPYSAYAIAVKYGYKGTEEEWVKEQEANRKAAEAAAAAAAQSAKDAAASASGVAQSGQQAVQNIKNAQTTALQAIDTAKQQAVQAAQAEAEKAATSAGQAASSAAEAAQSATNAAAEVGKVQNAGTAAVQAVQQAQNTATGAVADAQQTATQAVSQAQTTAVSAVQAEGTKQTNAVAAAASSALKGISDAKDAALSDVAEAGEAQVSAVGTAGTSAVQGVNDAKTAALKEIADANAALPSPTQSDAGKVPTVKADGSAYELAGPYAPLSAAIRPTASGNPVNITDSVEWPLQGLKVYGKSTQMTATGAQLFDAELFRGVEYDGVNVQILDDDTIVASGTTVFAGSLNILSAPFYISPGSYTISISQSINLYTSIVWYDSTLAIKEIVPGGVSASFKIEETTKIIIRFYKEVQAGEQINFSVKVMLNSGSTALPWEPYTGGQPSPSPDYPQEIVTAGSDGTIDITVSDGADQSQSLTISTPNGLPGIPVDSGGNYTDVSGQQWVCDEVDFAKGVYVKRANVFKVPSNYAFEFRNGYYNLLDESGGDQYIDNMRSEGAEKNILNTISPKNTIIGNGISGFFYISPNNLTSNFGSLEALNGLVSDGVLELLYPTDIIETPLSEDELAAYRAIHTYDGTAVISTPEDVAGIEVRYVANGEKYIDRKISEAIASAAETKLAAYDTLSGAIHEGVNEA